MIVNLEEFPTSRTRSAAASRSGHPSHLLHGSHCNTNNVRTPGINIAKGWKEV